MKKRVVFLIMVVLSFFCFAKGKKSVPEWLHLLEEENNETLCREYLEIPEDETLLWASAQGESIDLAKAEAKSKVLLSFPQGVTTVNGLKFVGEYHTEIDEKDKILYTVYIFYSMKE